MWVEDEFIRGCFEDGRGQGYKREMTWRTCELACIGQLRLLPGVATCFGEHPVRIDTDSTVQQMQVRCGVYYGLTSPGEAARVCRGQH